MILWMFGYLAFNGDFTYFAIIGGILYPGLLIGNLYMTYYYMNDKRTGIPIVIVLVAWGINYAILNPLLIFIFLSTNLMLFGLNFRLVNNRVNINKLEYPITFYFQNMKIESIIIIAISTILYWYIVFRAF